MMPPVEDLAVEAVAHLVHDGYTSSVMKLPRPVLNELGRRLVTAGESVHDAAVQWLADEGHAIPKTNVYRFAQRFREVYKLIWAEWANKLLMAELAKDDRFDTGRMQTLIKNRVHTLVAQEVIAANPEDLDTGRLNAVLNMVAAADKGQLEREKLQLAQADAERKLAESQAKIERMAAEAEQRKRAVEQRVKALQSRIDELEKQVRAGKQSAIDPQIFAAMRDELVALGREGNGEPGAGSRAAEQGVTV